MATITRETINQYRDTVASGSVPSDLFIRDVPDFIPIMRRADTPMITLMPRKGSRDKVIWEFGEGDLAPRRDALNGAVDAATLTIPVDNGVRFQVWDMIKIDDEVMIVSAINTNNLTVRERGHGSTAPAPHDDNAVVKILGPAVPEGADAPDSPIAKGQVYQTYPQILEYTWEFTHRGRIVPNYEVKGDQFKAEMKKKMKEAAEDLDDLLLNGIKSLGDGTKTNPSTMGGLREFTTAYTLDLNTGTAAPLEFADLMTTLQRVYNDVGQADMAKTVMGTIYGKRIWNSWFQPSRRATIRDAKMKMDWSEVETDFGTLKYVLNHKMDDDELIVWNPQDCGVYHFEGGNWSTGLYSTQGWYDRGFLRGDLGGLYEGDRRRCRIYGFSNVDADYDNLDVAA